MVGATPNSAFLSLPRAAVDFDRRPPLSNQHTEIPMRGSILRSTFVLAAVACAAAIHAPVARMDLIASNGDGSTGTGKGRRRKFKPYRRGRQGRRRH
jgi:hypothetical protein